MTSAPAVGADAGHSSRGGSGVETSPPRDRSLAPFALLLGTFAWLVLTASPVAAAPNSLALSATYETAAYIRWGRGSMTVASTAHVTNTTDARVRALTFNLVPLITGAAQLVNVAVGGQSVDATTTDQSVIVPLPKPLRPGQRTNVRIRYRAAFNAVADSHQSLFSQQDDIITAYRWIPWLSRTQAFSAPNFGETWVSAVSPHVTVTFTSPQPLVFATSGDETKSKGHSQTFEATNVRDFNFTASPSYKMKAVSWNGVAVNVFYRTLPPRKLARYAVAALQSFSDAVGPYPYRHFNVAETPGGSGMESPALSWIPADAEDISLERLVTHEVAHQWFYAAVGNNQALRPFVDEAMADFLTADMLDKFHTSHCPRAALDGTVYDYNAQCYPEVVYVQGSRYLDHYLQQVGSTAFWTGLRQFYADYAFKIAGTRTLLDYLDAASGYDSQLHVDRFPSLYP